MADQQITHRKWRLLLPCTLSHHQLTFLLLLNHPISHLLVLFHLKYMYEALKTASDNKLGENDYYIVVLILKDLKTVN